MKSVKVFKLLAWLAVGFALILALLSDGMGLSGYYGAVMCLLAMILTEIWCRKSAVAHHFNERFGTANLEWLAIACIAVTVMMCFSSLKQEILWLVIVLAGGWLIARLLVPYPSQSVAKN